MLLVLLCHIVQRWKPEGALSRLLKHISLFSSHSACNFIVSVRFYLGYSPSLTKKYEAVFSSLPPLQQRLKGIQNSKVIFTVENGICYCIKAGIEQKLTDAANKDKRLSTGRSPQDVSALDQTLSSCAECLGNCDQVTVEAAKTSSCTTVLEKEVLEDWIMFCMRVHDVSEILPIVGLNFMLLVGKPGNPGVSLAVPLEKWLIPTNVDRRG